MTVWNCFSLSNAHLSHGDIQNFKLDVSVNSIKISQQGWGLFCGHTPGNETKRPISLKNPVVEFVFLPGLVVFS